MDDLLREFLTEANESLDTIDNQLVRFEQDVNKRPRVTPPPQNESIA